MKHSFALLFLLFSALISLGAHTRISWIPFYNEAFFHEPIPLGLYLESEPGWHTYSDPSGDSGLPTTVHWDLPPGVTPHPIKWPKPKIYKEEGVVTYGYDGATLLPMHLEINEKIFKGDVLHLKGRVEWLECNGLCLPQSELFELSLPIVKEISARTLNSQATGLWPNPSANKMNPQAKEYTLFWMLLWAFIGGLILNFMPCVFPVIGLKVLSFMEQSQNDPSKAKLHGAVFTLGVWLSFCSLAGVLLFLRNQGHALGWGFQLQSPGFILALVALLFTLGWNLLGVFEVGLSLMNTGNQLAARSGYMGSFFSGVLATVVATPCTAPFMGAALGFALSQSTFIAMSVFSMMALGMSAPYFLLTCFPALLKKMPRPGDWMETFKHWMAFPLFATVIWLLSVFTDQTSTKRLFWVLWMLLALGIAVWVYGRFCKAYDSKISKVIGFSLIAISAFGANFTVQKALEGDIVESSEGLNWEPYSEERLMSFLKDSRYVFVNFTASWCLTCQANLHGALSSSAVVEAFQKANVVCLKADWTKRDPELTATLAKLGRSGVPTYALYKPTDPEPIMLPEILTEDIVLEALQ